MSTIPNREKKKPQFGAGLLRQVLAFARGGLLKKLYWFIRHQEMKEE
jgi:hypothetical protein